MQTEVQQFRSPRGLPVHHGQRQPSADSERGRAELSRQTLIERARAEIGTKWRHQGRSPGDVLDCVGLLDCIGRDFGFRVPHEMNYSPTGDGSSLEEILGSVCDEVPIDDLMPGDIVSIMIGRKARVVQHAALVTLHPTGNFALLHSSRSKRMVVEHIMDQRWRDSISKCWRIPGIQPWPQ